jgi:excisionase family DNA binding protein
MPRLYDVVDSAERLSISPWTIRAKIREGLIRPVRIGRRVLIEERELERVIAEGRQLATEKNYGPTPSVAKMKEVSQ